MSRLVQHEGKSMINNPSRAVSGAVTVLLLASFLVLALPRPARACSCAGPIDLTTAIDESQAAFVGSLIEKRNVGIGEFGSEAIYVFEVEEWIKGDLGSVIEVRSASDGAGCGFEFFGDDRIGAFLRLEGGELHSSLCEQADPDALLTAAKGPVPSVTGVGHLLIAHGWSSPRLTVLDRHGGTVTDLSPGFDPEPFTGTTELVACPEGRNAVQLTSKTIEVWDLGALKVTATYPATSADGRVWARTISCRAADASSILGIGQSETGATLYEIVPEWEPLLDVPGETWHIGTSYVIAQLGHENDPTVVDIESGETKRIHETPPGSLQAISVAPHPRADKLVMLETRFPDGEGRVESTLFLMDARGHISESYEIPWEAYSPVWLDDERVLVQAYDFNDWERSFGYLLDVSTGEMEVIEGWRGTSPIADGSVIYGIDGARVIMADMSIGEIQTLGTLPVEFAGPMVMLSNSDPVQATTTTSGPTVETTPPIVAPEIDVAEQPSAGLRWLTGALLVAFVGGLYWMTRRSV